MISGFDTGVYIKHGPLSNVFENLENLTLAVASFGEDLQPLLASAGLNHPFRIRANPRSPPPKQRACRCVWKHPFTHFPSPAVHTSWEDYFSETLMWITHSGSKPIFSWCMQGHQKEIRFAEKVEPPRAAVLCEASPPLFLLLSFLGKPEGAHRCAGAGVQASGTRVRREEMWFDGRVAQMAMAEKCFEFGKGSSSSHLLPGFFLPEGKGLEPVVGGPLRPSLSEKGCPELVSAFVTAGFGLTSRTLRLAHFLRLTPKPKSWLLKIDKGAASLPVRSLCCWFQPTYQGCRWVLLRRFLGSKMWALARFR